MKTTMKIAVIAMMGMSLGVSAQDEINTHLYINGVDNTNTKASNDQLKVSGYGIMGNRHSLYFTNGADAGAIKFGVGNVHGSDVVLELNKSKASFTGNIEANRNLYINGVDNTNTKASNDQLKVSGYGIMGNRHSLYFTNGADAGTIKFGVGNVHGSGIVLELNKSKASFNGKVAIGTPTMGNHKLAVEGLIGAREIKVEAAPNWSDFVFYDNYNLPTLQEVENHIKEKGHLKDIPSAKEVEKNGFFLGEMDAKLLQKIEELTLYTIAQEKEIEELKKQKIENEEQQKEIEELKALVQKLIKDKN